MSVSKLTKEQLRYMAAILAAPDWKIEAWRLYQKLHKSSYPYFYFLKRLTALQKKGLIALTNEGKRGGLMVRI